VDTQRVIMAGFSQGGKMALDIALNDVIPVTGFVVLQPGKTLSKEISKENLEKIVKRGLRGTIIDSESPASSREQQRITSINRELNLAFRYLISGTGHWYPGDFLKQLDTALKDILAKK
jgi:dienelactone hydrolase